MPVHKPMPEATFNKRNKATIQKSPLFVCTQTIISVAPCLSAPLPSPAFRLSPFASLVFPLPSPVSPPLAFRLSPLASRLSPLVSFERGLIRCCIILSSPDIIMLSSGQAARL